VLRIDRTQRRLQRLESRSLPEVGLTEREDLQKMIRQSDSEFFAEIGEQVMLVGEEEKPADFVDDRIDLLGIDPSGAAVVIELKRTSHKLHLLQAVAYAGMLAKWEPADFVESRQRLANLSYEASEAEIESFLVDELTTVNHSQRIVLLADAFDFGVLIAAEWLTERYGVDIRCYRFELARDGEADFLSCVRVYPPPELTQHAIRRGRRSEPGTTRKSTWDEIFEWSQNPEVPAFFKRALADGAEDLVRTRRIRLSAGKGGLFYIQAGKNFARVVQVGRFTGDEGFWRSRLSESARLAPKKNGRRLGFRLHTAADFESFSRAQSELAAVQFVRPEANDHEEDDSGEDGDE